MAEELKQGILTGKLRENTMTQDDPNDYMLQIKSRGTVNLEDLARDITAMRSGFMYQTVQDILLCFKEAIIKRVADGFTIHTGIFNGYVKARGTYRTTDVSLDASKGQFLTWVISPGAEVIEKLQTVKVEIDGKAPRGPQVNRVEDVKTGEENGRITPGRNLKIYGDKLTIAGDNEANGIYFVRDGVAPVKVDPTDIVDNRPKQLTVVIPALEAGDYTLRIVTQYSSASTNVKEPRSIDFENLLTVVDEPKE